ncbi:YccJ family protein [Pectobacterium carotovorum]|uniref:YccJ family protein n=1 Tax=Pectobacterium carotovorum TaxID=554 RepID=UPI0021F375B6|nr:YccJ family protein [Pectobacterium carotovorum]
MTNSTIKSFADSRETSIEIAEAIFELAGNDESVAQSIWENGDDRVAPLAFSKTDEDELFWGEEKVTR